MAGKIFLNYRRDDEAGFTHALYLRLEGEFAPGDLFMYVGGHIKPGDDFIKVLTTKLLLPTWGDIFVAVKADFE